MHRWVQGYVSALVKEERGHVLEHCSAFFSPVLRRRALGERETVRDFEVF